MPTAFPRRSPISSRLSGTNSPSGFEAFDGQLTGDLVAPVLVVCRTEMRLLSGAIGSQAPSAGLSTLAMNSKRPCSSTSMS